MADTFLGQLKGAGVLRFAPAPGYRIDVTISHVGTDYAVVIDEKGVGLFVPVAAIAWWAPK